MNTKHKHHIIPKHAGGSNDQSNIVELSVEEHAQAHKELYEKYNRWQDKVAWKGLSGRIGKEEIIRMKHSESAKATIYTEEKRRNMSLGQLGKKYPDRKGKCGGEKNNFHGKTHSECSKRKMSDAAKGRLMSEETRRKMSKATKGIPKPKIECPHCGKIGGSPQMKRHHFDNCQTLH